MPTFLCKIGGTDGRVLDKEFEAGSRDLLRESLQEQGFQVFSIRRRHFQALRGGKAFQGRWSSRRFLSFNQELLVLLRSGLPILQALDTILERVEAGGMLQMLRDVREDIRGGSALSDAFGKFPRSFPPLYVASIRAGERTGDLPINLERYIAYQKRVEAIKAKLKNAAFYPTLLSIAVVIVVLFLMLYVVPRFTQIYADAHVQLPLVTRLLIASTQALTAGLPLLIPALVGGLVVLRLFLQTERGIILYDRAKLRVPLIGRLLNEYALLSFCRTLGTLLASGIPIIQALQMARGTLNNRVLEGRILGATRRVEEGASVSAAFDQAGFFPNIALRMISVGEAGGSLAVMLNDVAEYYESEVEQRLERMTTLIEPVMMASMGLLIGGIVIAMYIPIFQLAGTV
jgi:type IV pilus assembly protein PilC